MRAVSLNTAHSGTTEFLPFSCVNCEITGLLWKQCEINKVVKGPISDAVSVILSHSS